MKGKVNKPDVNKLVPALVDLSKLSDAVKYDVKKVLYNTKIKNIEDKIPDINNLATNTYFNVKINEAKGEIPDITSLATTAALATAVQNKIPTVTDLVKKVDYDAELSEIENKYFTTFHYDKSTSNNTVDGKITQKS